MHCVVINGTEVKGCTYHLKELFLDELKPTTLTEFTFPKDAPPYCTGCKRCFLESEDVCPHVEQVQPIWQAMLDADLIVFTYPVNVLRAPGQVKSFLDHLGVHWFVHRPKETKFHKTAVIITQSIGAPNGAAQKDVKTSLEWLGAARIKTIGFGMMEGVVWNELLRKEKEGLRTQTARVRETVFASHATEKERENKVLFSDREETAGGDTEKAAQGRTAKRRSAILDQPRLGRPSLAEGRAPIKKSRHPFHP